MIPLQYQNGTPTRHSRTRRHWLARALWIVGAASILLLIAIVVMHQHSMADDDLLKSKLRRLRRVGDAVIVFQAEHYGAYPRDAEELEKCAVISVGAVPEWFAPGNVRYFPVAQRVRAGTPKAVVAIDGSLTDSLPPTVLALREDGEIEILSVREWQELHPAVPGK